MPLNVTYLLGCFYKLSKCIHTCVDINIPMNTDLYSYLVLYCHVSCWLLLVFLLGRISIFVLLLPCYVWPLLANLSSCFLRIYFYEVLKVLFQCLKWACFILCAFWPYLFWLVHISMFWCLTLPDVNLRFCDKLRSICISM